MSYYQQLWPGLRYGLGTLSNSFSAAEDCLCKFDYLLLPPYIGIDRNIKRECRTLHSAFGGLGLLSLVPIEQFICRTTILLQHYNTSSIIGNKLTCSIHLLQLQISTNSNPLCLSHRKFGHLAPPSWLNSYWESLNKYPIDLHLDYDVIPPPHQFDNTIMSFLLQYQYIPTAPILTSINRCRCFLNLLFLSGMTTADGRLLDPELICINAPPRKSNYFPPEHPTQDNWLTWIDIWNRALGRHLLLPKALGEWEHPSHFHWHWYYDESTDCIIEDIGSHKHLFSKDNSRSAKTHSGNIYTLTSVDYYASEVELIPASCTILPSWHNNKHRISLRNVGPSPSIQNKLPATFWDDILKEFGGTWMWQNMHLDFDASVDWFLTAVSHNSLIWVMDGSYTPLSAPDISGAGWIVKDCSTNRRWACSFYEVSEHANSYRAELLGLYSIHDVFVLALSKYFELLNNTTVKLRCDNKGALRTSSWHHKRIQPTSKCADILCCLHTLHKKLRDIIHIHYAYGASHMDDILQWHDLTLEQQLNVQCDTLAKAAVTQAACTFHSGTPHPNTNMLPLEQCATFINNRKLPLDISHPPLRFECSKLKSKDFLCTQHVDGLQNNSTK